jgi:hypothetical protein
MGTGPGRRGQCGNDSTARDSDTAASGTVEDDILGSEENGGRDRSDGLECAPQGEQQILRVATGTQQELVWSATDMLGVGRTKWTTITALADGDVRYWRAAREESIQQAIAASTV